MTTNDLRKIFYHPAFVRDLKSLCKKHKSLVTDFDLFLKVVMEEGEARGTVVVSNLGSEYSQYRVLKVRKFRCREMSGKGSKSGFRIIYAEFQGYVVFIQMYLKSQDELEDRGRIKQALDLLKDGKLGTEFIRHETNSVKFLLD